MFTKGLFAAGRRLIAHWKGFLSLLYPELCVACGSAEVSGARIFCVGCQYSLPETGFHRMPDNPFEQRFWGRVQLISGAALYYFVRGGKVQRIVHQLKYRGRRDVGTQLGEYYGRQLREVSSFSGVDLIIPVPLHPRKRRRRGYNQSYEIAFGLARSLEAEVREDVLLRVAYTGSQTGKSRMDRFENVRSAFILNRPALVRGKHVLLVDDVLTTGATLEACAEKITDVEGVRLSMVTLAMAET